MHYHVKRAYAPIMLSTKVVRSSVEVFAVNDFNEEENVEFLMQAMTLNGKIISETRRTEILAPHSSQKLGRFPCPLENQENLMFLAMLLRDDSIISRSFHYFIPTKEMNLSDPGLTVKIEDSDAGLLLIVHCEKLARQVFLEAPGIEGQFEVNFFDMAAGETRHIKFVGVSDMDKLSQILKIRSIYDTYN